MIPSIRNMTSVYFVNDQKLLCLFRIGSRIADQLYVGAAGGHFEENELCSAEACVLREMKEELNLAPSDIHSLRLRYITLRIKNGEIRHMPVSAKHMIRHYLKEGRNTGHLYAGITEENDTVFTIMKEF